MAGTLNVLVFAPIGKPQSMEMSGRFSVNEKEEFRSEIVGFLSPTDPGEAAIERLRQEMEPSGATVDLIVRQSSNTPGYMACNVACRVSVPNMEAAHNLPGFCGLYDHTGDHYTGPLFVNHENDCLVRRVGLLSEHRAPDWIGLPKYNEAGEAVFSLIPLGRLGRVVFLKDQPGRWYFNRDDRLSDAEAVVAVRKWIGEV